MMINNLMLEHNGKIAFHPGYYIKEIVEDENITQEEFAKKLGTTPKTVSKLINGSANITSDIAIKLSNMYNTSTDVWSNLQKNYDDLINEIEKEKLIKSQEIILKQIDYNFFIEEGFLPKVRNTTEKIKGLCNFFKVSNLSNFYGKDFCVNFRNENTNITEANILNSNLWVETAIIKGKSLNLENKFDKEKLINSIPEIRSMVTKEPKEFYDRLNEIFKECGVAFVLLPPLKNSKINGAVKWLNKDTVILAINNRRKYADIFWFSLFHEIKHVLQEKTKRLILSNVHEFEYIDRNLEEEADEYSKNKLIPHKEYQKFIENFDFSKESIIRFAEEVDTHSGIVVGRLQREGFIRYNQYNELREKYYITKD